MILNENNVNESIRIFEQFEKYVLKDLGEDGKYIKTSEGYVVRKLSCLSEIFACLEMNDRYGKSNPPTPKQLDFALSLAKKNPEKAKELLKGYGKQTIDKLDPKECSEFIDMMRAR